MTKTDLRKLFLKKRQLLSPLIQQQKAQSLLERFLKLPLFTKSQHIAFYWPIKGEISPLPILEKSFLAHKQCYLPVLDNREEKLLLFTHYQKADLLKMNRFGILEPSLEQKAPFPAKELDLVLVPLLAFDLLGHRLGMGKGYYDYTFSFLNENRSSQLKKPFLLGLAYDEQEATLLSTDAWDISLQGILTESRTILI